MKKKPCSTCLQPETQVSSACSATKFIYIFAFQVDLIHINSVPGNDTVSYGMDLSEYYLNVEWDILSVPAERHVKKYPCCPEPYPDIYFNMIIRRKPLFYIVNLIIPCVGIFYLSILVFYMPAQSKQKTSLVCTERAPPVCLLF